MDAGEVGFSAAGANAQPSPSIWKDCPQDLLNRDGRGYYFHKDFLGSPLVNTTITAALLARLTAEGLSISGDDDTVLTQKTGEQGGYLDIETDGDDNDAAAIFTDPFAQIVLESGNKVWFEARLELGAVADQGVFVGLAEKAALSLDVVADNTAALIGESLIGFQILSGDTDAVDAVFKLDNGTVAVIQSDINLDTALAAPANLAQDTEFKVGFVFDGKHTLSVYFNGTLVAKEVLLASTFPDNVLMGAIVAIKTGTGAAQSIAVDWVRGAAQVR